MVPAWRKFSTYQSSRKALHLPPKSSASCLRQRARSASSAGSLAGGETARDDGELGSQVAQGQLRDIHAVDCDGPRAELDDAEEELGDGRLARARSVKQAESARFSRVA